MNTPASAPFVGRAQQVSHVLRLFEDARSGGEQARVLLTGGEGTGKTRLVERVTEQALELKFRILLYECQKWDRYHPYSVMSGLVRMLLGKSPGWTPRSLDTLQTALRQRFASLGLEKQQAEVLHWLLGAPVADEKEVLLAERSRQGLAARMFGEMVRHQLDTHPHLMIAVEDIQHCDSRSADCLLNSDFGAGTFMLVTLDSPAKFQSRREFERVDLPPFGVEEVKELARAMLGRDLPAEELVPEIVKVTRGSPLEIAALLTQISGDYASPEKAQRLLSKGKRGAAEALRESLVSLPPDALTLMQAASVVADSFPQAIVKSMLGVRFPWNSSLRTLTRGRLAVSQVRRGVWFFHFDNSGVRDAAYSTMEGAQKERMHAAAAAALRRYFSRSLNRHLMQLAFHYEMADDGENAAEAYLDAGPYLYRIGEFSLSLEAYQNAQRLSQDGQKKLRALAGCINALEAQARTKECLELAREFFKSSPPPQLQASVYADLTRLHAHGGEHVKAIECGLKAVDLAQRHGDSSTFIKAASFLTFALAMSERTEEALSYGSRALEEAKKSRDPHVVGVALSVLGTANMEAGNLHRANQLYEQSAEMFRKSGFLFNYAILNLNLGTTLHALGHLTDAAEAFRKAGELLEEMGAAGSAGTARCYHAAITAEIGRCDEALALVQETMLRYRDVEYAPIQRECVATRAAILLKKGLVRETLALLDEKCELLARTRRWSEEAAVCEIQIEAAILSGELDKALDISSKMVEEASGHEGDKFLLRALIQRLTVLVEAGRLEEADGVAERIGALDISGMDLVLDASARASLARLACAKGETGRAGALLDELASAGLPGPDTLAAIELALGRAFLRAGDSAGARRHLKGAVGRYSRLVEHGYRERELDIARRLLEEARP